MYRLLFVTDKLAVRKALKSGLLEQGCQATFVESSALLGEDAAPPKADIIVLDLEDNRLQPHALCHALRRDRALKDLPLILLLAESQLGTIDWSWGIDDYLILPISAKRLTERVKFFLWKLNKVELKNGLKIGGLSIDFERYEVHVKGEPADLTYKEFELLTFLARHPGKVCTREALLDKVWGYDYYGGTRTVDVHIRRLRSKIESGGSTYIETVRHVGYKFLAPE